MTEPLRLRVMTFNIHGGRPKVGLADLEATARVIREVGPDLASLQEVHRYLPPPYVFQDQPRVLRKLLNMVVTFQSSLGIGPIGYGHAILSRDAPASVERIRLPGGGEPRTLCHARFSLQGRDLHLLSTHLTLGEEDREKQARVLVERLQGIDQPVILMGDLNSAVDSVEVRMLEEAGLGHCAASDVCTFPCDAPETRLDHIMVSRHFQVQNCDVVKTEVSDHLPLYTDLLLP